MIADTFAVRLGPFIENTGFHRNPEIESMQLQGLGKYGTMSVFVIQNVFANNSRNKLADRVSASALLPRSSLGFLK